MVIKSKIIFAVLLTALAIGALLAMSRTANADALSGGAVIAQVADTTDSSRLGGARAGIGRAGFARPGVGRPGIGRPAFAGIENRPNIGAVRPVQPIVRPPIVRPPIVRPVVQVVNEVNAVVCDEELLILLQECVNVND